MIKCWTCLWPMAGCWRKTRYIDRRQRMLHRRKTLAFSPMTWPRNCRTKSSVRYNCKRKVKQTRVIPQAPPNQLECSRQTLYGRAWTMWWLIRNRLWVRAPQSKTISSRNSSPQFPTHSISPLSSIKIQTTLTTLRATSCREVLAVRSAWRIFTSHK